MRLTDYAKLIGCTYKTAHNHFKSGKIAGAYKLPTGIVIVPDNIMEKLENEYNNTFE